MREKLDETERKRRHTARASGAVQIRRLRETESEAVMGARGWEKIPDWYKPKTRKCLWCDKDIENAETAGERYHPNCRYLATRY